MVPKPAILEGEGELNYYQWGSTFLVGGVEATSLIVGIYFLCWWREAGVA